MASNILTIGDLAARTGLAVSAIRFYETHGIVAPLRNAGGHRRYGKSDLLVPLLFGAAAFYLTMGLNGPRYRSNGNVRYWRGKRIDDD